MSLNDLLQWWNLVFVLPFGLAATLLLFLSTGLLDFGDRETGFQIDVIGADDRQQIGVAPDRMRPGLNGFAGNALRDDVVVVVNFERAEAKFTNVLGFEFVGCGALAAFQTFEARRRSGSTRCVAVERNGFIN